MVERPWRVDCTDSALEEWELILCTFPSQEDAASPWAYAGLCGIREALAALTVGALDAFTGLTLLAQFKQLLRGRRFNEGTHILDARRSL